MKKKITKLKETLKEKFFLAGLGLTSLLLQLSFINKSSIWHDEGFTALLIDKGFGQIIARTARDVHPPLYYLSLSLWTSIFGTSEAALRSMSAVFVVGSVIVAYKLVKNMFNVEAARAAAVFVAFGPLLFRYGQEARMFVMVAFMLILATLFLVEAIKFQDKKKLIAYTIVMALAFYTQYYAVFVVPVHWLYVALNTRWLTDRKNRLFNSIKSMKWLPSSNWWLANVAIVTLFLPWVPVALKQFGGIQGGYWIPEVTYNNLLSTFYNFLAFTDFTQWAQPLRIFVALAFIFLVFLVWKMNSKFRKEWTLLVAYAAIPPLAVYALSVVSQPIYINRYFVASSIGFYALLGVMLYLKPISNIPKIRPAVFVAILLLFSFGTYRNYNQASHQMRDVAREVNNKFIQGDELLVGEIFVMLDFSYYNETNREPRIYAPSGEVVNNGEISLFDDRLEDIVVQDLNKLSPSTKRVWMLGKSGEKDYFENVPANWELLERFQYGDSVAQLYLIFPQSQTYTLR